MWVVVYRSQADKRLPGYCEHSVTFQPADKGALTAAAAIKHQAPQIKGGLGAGEGYKFPSPYCHKCRYAEILDLPKTALMRFMQN